MGEICEALMASKSAGLLYPREVFLRAASQPKLVSGRFGKEVGFGGKDLCIEQFGFDGVVNAFDVGVGVGAGRGVEAMFGLIFLFDGQVVCGSLIVGGAAVEFEPPIGGDDDLGGVDVMVIEMFKEPIDSEGGVSFGKLIAIGQELWAPQESSRRVYWKRGRPLACIWGQ